MSRLLIYFFQIEFFFFIIINNFPKIYLLFFFQVVQELALVMYAALDIGLKEDEERTLSPGMENLLAHMISAGRTQLSFLGFQRVQRVQKIQR